MTRHRILWLLLASVGACTSVFATPVQPFATSAPSTCAVIPLASAQATAEEPAPAMGTRQDRGDADPVVRYQITATLDPVSHTLQGAQRMTWRNRSALPVCTLYLQLDLNAFEGAGSRLMAERRASGGYSRLEGGEWGYSQLTRIQQSGQSAVWTYEQPEGGPVTDHTVVRVDLPQPVAPGASTTLDIGFVDRLPGARTGTGYYGSFHLVAHWFPQIAALELPGERGATRTRWNATSFLGRNRTHLDPANFDVRLDVPRGFSVGATGEQLGAPAVRGNRLIYRFVQDEIADFAWTADARFAAPLESRYTTPDGRVVKLRVLYHPEHAVAAAAALDMMTDAFGYYSRRLPGYPHRTLTAVITPYNTGALANKTYPTLFTVEGRTSAAPGTVRGERIDLDTLRGVSELYLSSVLGSSADPELLQGMRAYWTARRLQERGQLLHEPGGWLRRLSIQPVLDSFSAMRLDADLSSAVDGIDMRAARIALSLHDLQERIGTPAMDRALWLFAQRPRSGQSDLASLREALAEAGNLQPSELAFARNIEDTRLVDDRIAHFSSEEVLPQPGYVDYKGQRIELTPAMIDRAVRARRVEWKRQHRSDEEGAQGAFPYRTTVVVHRNGALVPQMLQVKFADGSIRRIYWNNTQPSPRFSWITPFPAVSAQLDPQQVVLLDRNKLDDGRTLQADTAPVRRWAGDVAALVQVISGFLVSL